MRASVVLLLVACGCHFHVGGAQGSDAVDATVANDADVADLAIGAGPDDLVAAAPADLSVPFCGEPSLVACWTFDDARDGTANHNDLTLSGGAAIVAGGHRGSGLTVPVGGLAHVAHNASFDVAAVTLEAWIKPTALPTGGARAGIFDEDGQYGMFIYPPGVLTCAMTTSVSSPMNTVTVGAWQHVACTFDQQTVRVYYDGALVASQASTATLPTNQPNGACVGSNSPSGDEFAGVVDDVRVFSVARSAAQICAAAGGNGC